MDGFLKKVRTNALVTAVLYAVLGLVLLLRPMMSVKLLCWMLGGVLVICGATYVIFFARHKDGTLYSSMILVLGIIFAAMGAWVFSAGPQFVAVLLPRIIGVLICIHGIANLGDAISLQRAGYPRWATALALGLVTIALGALLVFRSFAVLTTAVRFIGAFLLYDGISDLWIVSRLSKAAKHSATGGVVDVDFRDSDT